MSEACCSTDLDVSGNVAVLHAILGFQAIPNDSSVMHFSHNRS